MAELLVRGRGATSIYRHLVAARVRADLQYRTSLVLFTIGQFIAAGMDFAAMAVIFGQVKAIAGWTFYQVLFLYGTAGVSFGLGDLVISPVERAAFHIRQGSFDQFLLRPVGTLLQLVCEEFALRRIGRLIQPAVVLAVALPNLNVAWTPARDAVLVATLGAGAVIFSSLWVITSALAFWTVETQEVANSFTYGGSFIAQYPLDVLGGWLRRLVLFVPLAFVNYLPASWLLHRPNPLRVAGPIRLASPAISIATAVLAAAVWRSAVRHYRSTGS